jgi:hypothetical protein
MIRTTGLLHVGIASSVVNARLRKFPRQFHQAKTKYENEAGNYVQ